MNWNLTITTCRAIKISEKVPKMMRTCNELRVSHVVFYAAVVGELRNVLGITIDSIVDEKYA